MDMIGDEIYADFELHQFSTGTINHRGALISFKNKDFVYIYLNSLEVLLENNVEDFRELETNSDYLKKVEINFLQKQQYTKLILLYHTSNNGKLAETKWGFIIELLSTAKISKYLGDCKILTKNKSIKDRLFLDYTITIDKINNKKSLSSKTATTKTTIFFGNISPIKQKFGTSVTTTTPTTITTSNTHTLSTTELEPIEMDEEGDLPPIKSRLTKASVESKLNKEFEKSDNHNHNSDDNGNNFKRFKSSNTSTITNNTENIFDSTTEPQIKKPFEVKYQHSKTLEDKKREEQQIIKNELDGKYDDQCSKKDNCNYSRSNEGTTINDQINNNSTIGKKLQMDKTKKRQFYPNINTVRPPKIYGSKQLFTTSNYKSGASNNNLVNTHPKIDMVDTPFDFDSYNQTDIPTIHSDYEDDSITGYSNNKNYQNTYTDSALYNILDYDDIYGGGSSSNSGEIILSKHKGLFNLGNTCYMNVILQSLFGIDKLYSDIKFAQVQSFEKNIEIYNLFMEVWEAIRTTDEEYYLLSMSSFKTKFGDICVDPKSFKLSIDKLTPMFKGFRQHDAHEFLVSFLGVLEEALKTFFVKKIGNEKQISQTTENEITNSLKLAEEVDNIADMNISSSGAGGDKDSDKDSEDDEKEKQMDIEKLKVEKSIQDKEFKETISTMVEDCCPINTNFKSSITNIFQCCNCDDIQYSVEVFNDISLNVPKTVGSTPLSSNYHGSINKGVKLNTLVEQYLKEEVIERKCTKCKHEKSKLLKAFKKTSDILVLHLKRFQMDSTGKRFIKIDSTVEPLDSITLNQYDIIIPESNNNEEEVEKETTSTNIDKKIDQEQIDNNNSVNSNNNVNNNENKEEKEKEEKKMEEATTKSTTPTISTTPKNNLLNEIIRKSERKTVKYSLQSIVVHSGTVDCGHYTCCMNVNNTWKQFDDSCVTSIDKSTVLSKTRAYIFFYIKNSS